MDEHSPSSTDDFSDIRNEQMNDARFAVAHITCEALAELAKVLRNRGSGEEDKTLIGLGVLADMASQTGRGALQLYHDEIWYAGAALTRQLVEQHYLCEYFAQDSTRVELWLDADSKQIRSLFATGKIRNAGGFTKTDYAAHCTWGGHPNPRGIWLVAENAPMPRKSLLLIDIAQHMQFMYVAMVKCIGQDASNEIPGMVKAFNYILKWRKVDPYSTGIPVADRTQAESGQAD
jgi:hypothetical protein